MKQKKLPKFLFVHLETENIGIEYLSAALKKNNVPIDLLFLPRIYNNIAFHFGGGDESKNEKFLIIAKIKQYKPDIVCFSPFTSQYLWTITQATMIKKKFPEIFVLFGGVHVNSVPDEVMKQKCVDGLILGEADTQIVEFAKNFYDLDKLKSVESLWIREGKKIVKNKLAKLVANLDILPFPDKDIFYDQIPKQLLDTSYVIMASRGCPFACTYCANNVYQKLYIGQRRLRFRTPENVVAELVEAKKKYHYKMVEFFDDVLTIDEKRLEILLKLYRKKVGVPFTCYMHPQLVNENIIKLLKKSGCSWLKMGVQSANEQYRRMHLKRGESNKEIVAASDLCHKYNLTFSLDHIFNLPGETEENLIEAVELYTRCKPTAINYGTLIYLPGTEIIDLGIKQKLLTKNDVKLINLGKDPVVHMSNFELFSHQDDSIKNLNLSVYAMLLSLIPIAPASLIRFLINRKIYKWKRPVPQSFLVVLKVLDKMYAKQMFVYASVFRTLYYYYIKDKWSVNKI